MTMDRHTSRTAQIAIEMLFLSAVIVTVIAGFTSLAGSFLQLSVRAQNKLQAFAIAEAGIDYYQWHLAYAPTDYQDGTGHAGPYIHNYYDQNGTAIGQFSLTITPPPSGSTVVTVTSVGTVLADPSITKIIKVQMGIPSFAKYAWVLNSNVVFGTAAQVYGVIDSNGGVQFNGVAHNLVESAQTTFVDPNNNSTTEWGVYTTNAPADPRPPTALPTSSSNVFLAGRAVGVPAVDFTGITQDLATIAAAASSTGYYATSSGAFGYDLALSSTTFTVYKVTALVAAPGGCTAPTNPTESGWGTWSVKTETPYATGTIPQNGDMFFADNLWVRGAVNGARVTIASGKFPANPSTYTNIIVNSSTNYTSFNGSDTIALIAQGNILFGLVSDNNLTVDAALIAQNGAIQRYYYSTSCKINNTDWYVRNQLTTLGIIGSNQQSGVAWGDPVTSGYSNRTYNYDTNLLYSPPPSFPLTTDAYSLISWEEVQ